MEEKIARVVDMELNKTLRDSWVAVLFEGGNGPLGVFRLGVIQSYRGEAPQDLKAFGQDGLKVGSLVMVSAVDKRISCTVPWQMPEIWSVRPLKFS